MMAQEVQFTPKAVEAMNRAYSAARQVLRREGAGQDAQVRAGEKIMVLGRSGETDEHRLYVAAVREALGRLPHGVVGR